MELSELMEELKNLLGECKAFAIELRSILELERDRSVVMRYKRMIDGLSMDNERLLRENKLLKSSQNIR